MVLGAFSGNLNGANLYFLSKTVTMGGSNNINFLKEYFLMLWRIYQYGYFMHDGALAHKSKIVIKFLKDNKITVLELPGNLSDLDPIKYVWNC